MAAHMETMYLCRVYIYIYIYTVCATAVFCKISSFFRNSGTKTKMRNEHLPTTHPPLPLPPHVKCYNIYNWYTTDNIALIHLQIQMIRKWNPIVAVARQI